MKKLTALVLSVGILFTMGACSGSKVDDDALDAFEKAIQNIADMKSAGYAASMKGEQAGQSFDLTISGAYNFETAVPQFSLAVDMAAQGVQVEDFMAFYLRDDTVYMNVLDMQKMKQEFLPEGQQLPNISLDKETMQIPKEELKKYLEEASLDGDQLMLVFDVDKINEEVKKGSEALQDDTLDAEDVTVKELRMEVTLENEQMRKANITMDFIQQEQEASVDMMLKFTDVGMNKPVDFPSDLNTYVEEGSASFDDSGYHEQQTVRRR